MSSDAQRWRRLDRDGRHRTTSSAAPTGASPTALSSSTHPAICTARPNLAARMEPVRYSKMTHTTKGAWKEKILYNFDALNGKDGGTPLDGVIFDGAGNLYGTTEIGRPLRLRGRSSRKLTPKAGGGLEGENLHNFNPNAQTVPLPTPAWFSMPQAISTAPRSKAGASRSRHRLRVVAQNWRRLEGQPCCTASTPKA